MEFRAIKRSTTPEKVAQEILRSIKAGDIRPGERLPPERDLTKMFGVGRSSVREAIVALVLLGFLEVIQGKGTFLRKDHPPVRLSASRLHEVLTAEDIVELMELREILEFSTVRRATKAHAPADIRRLRRAVMRMRNNSGDIKRFYQADLEFHTALAAATGNKMIHEVAKMVLERTYTYYARFFPESLFEPQKAADTAENILAALESGDAAQAVRHMREHLKTVRTGVVKVVPELKKKRGAGRS